MREPNQRESKSLGLPTGAWSIHVHDVRVPLHVCCCQETKIPPRFLTFHEKVKWPFHPCLPLQGPGVLELSYNYRQHSVEQIDPLRVRESLYPLLTRLNYRLFMGCFQRG